MGVAWVARKNLPGKVGVPPGEIVYTVVRMRGRRVFPGRDCLCCNDGL